MNNILLIIVTCDDETPFPTTENIVITGEEFNFLKQMIFRGDDLEYNDQDDVGDALMIMAGMEHKGVTRTATLIRVYDVSTRSFEHELSDVVELP